MQLTPKAIAMSRIVSHPKLGDYTVRPLVPSDVDFIRRNWLDAYFDAPPVQGMELAAYISGQSQMIGHIAEVAEVWVAEREGVAIGFLAGEKPDHASVTLHFIYVDAPFRKYGVGQCLLRCLGWRRNSQIVATHMTGQGERIARYNGKFKVAYNPYAAYFKF